MNISECISSGQLRWDHGCSQAPAQRHYTLYSSTVSIYFTSTVTLTLVPRKQSVYNIDDQDMCRLISTIDPLGTVALCNRVGGALKTRGSV